GYSDDYTDKDALFIRSTATKTVAGVPTTTSGLFAADQSALTQSATSATATYHDVYFDYDSAFRPYTFEPWFSSQYLTSGTNQSFALSTPSYSTGAASLTVTLWSLTSTDSASVDHALLVAINGQPVGQTQWKGGQKMMQVTFQIPASVLIDGSNSIDLTTPSLPGVNSQVAFLHSLTINYTKSHNAATPLTLVNSGTGSALFEMKNLPSANVWLVDARFPDRAALIPYEAQPQNDGTYRVRFNAPSGGSGQFLVVPMGSENKPLSVAKCAVKPATSVPYLAVGPAQFSTGVQPVLIKRAKEGIRASFVDQEQLFNYYNHGRYGPLGIQNAVRSIRPQYLLLVGRTTYDYRNYSGATVDPLCPAFLVPTTFWAQTTSDSLFGDMGRGYSEVAVGRLPVTTQSELANAVQHVLNYKGAPASGIRVHAVADQVDVAGDFPAQAAGLSQELPDFTWQQNFLGVTYQTSPEVTAAMTEAANGGADWLVYVGHGNASTLGNKSPRILTTTSVQNWTGNPVFLQSTCTANWMAKNVSDYKSIAIQALTQPQGGISASIGTSTYMNSNYAVAFMTRLMKTADANGMRWGVALMQTQQWAARQGGSYYEDLNRTEQLFGDPAMPVYARPVKSNQTNAQLSSPKVNQNVTPGQF
ncbi:MAG: C25 family cysteine peptidase, partial [Planctomycetota bacterium]